MKKTEGILRVLSPSEARKEITSLDIAGAVTDKVRAIIETVRREGDDALKRFTLEYDGERIGSIRVKPKKVKVDPELIAAMELAWERIMRYHVEFADESRMKKTRDGALWGRIVRPLGRVGIYVPGGTAPLFSTLLMAAAAARAAGVKDLAVATPPPVNDAIFAAAKIAGITEIYQVGGAQAIAALAWGTKSVKPVDKIVGPGNQYVTEAKRQVYGQVGIESLAGPTELVIVADESAKAPIVAADLLAQAEHSIDARAVLITGSRALVAAVQKAVAEQIDALPRRVIAGKALEKMGMIVLCKAEREMIELANAFATEHLELMVKNPWKLVDRITAAGAIFVGADSPEALGDYIAGPNHILPTGRTARFSGPLSARDFVSVSSIQWFPAGVRSSLTAAGQRLARAEELEGHARSLAFREELPSAAERKREAARRDLLRSSFARLKNRDS